MSLNSLEVRLVEVALKPAEQRRHPFGGEPVGVLVGDPSQLPQLSDEAFEPLDGARQDRAGEPSRQFPDSATFREGVHSDAVHAPDDRRLGDTVGEHGLAVEDLLRLGEADENHPFRHLVEEGVTGGHRGEQRSKLQVLN
ncbi:MAG: hypothetical protein ACRD0B_01530 [Acidimicrobiales bacterium]